MKKFLLVAKGDRAKWDAMSEKEWDEVMDGFGRWLAPLKEKNAYDGCHRLTGKGGFVRNTSGALTDGPFVETKELLTGVFFVRAESLEEAMKIARGSPCLRHDSMDVYEVEGA
jgi:hypothetical protein